MKDCLTLLKIKLMLEALDRVPNSEMHAQVIQEAQVACTQAAETSFPELVLPCLLTERVTRNLELQEQRDRGYWRQLTSM